HPARLNRRGVLLRHLADCAVGAGDRRSGRAQLLSSNGRDDAPSGRRRRRRRRWRWWRRRWRAPAVERLADLARIRRDDIVVVDVGRVARGTAPDRVDRAVAGEDLVRAAWAATAGGVTPERVRAGAAIDLVVAVAARECVVS